MNTPSITKSPGGRWPNGAAVPIDREPGVIAAVGRAGSYSALAKVLGISPRAVWNWKRVPAERCAQIEREVGVAREVLRPDLFERADG